MDFHPDFDDAASTTIPDAIAKARNGMLRDTAGLTQAELADALADRIRACDKAIEDEKAASLAVGAANDAHTRTKYALSDRQAELAAAFKAVQESMEP